MAAYVVTDDEVLDWQGYEEYWRGLPTTLERYGGHVLVRGGAAETPEGDLAPQRLVVLEFPSVERARAWYASPEYGAILPVRRQHARTRFLTIVEGALAAPAGADGPPSSAAPG